jgi:hypothetical protein
MIEFLDHKNTLVPFTNTGLTLLRNALYRGEEFKGALLKEKTEKLTLDIREWICNNCNTLLDRDINAARNHLRFGSESLDR